MSKKSFSHKLGFRQHHSTEDQLAYSTQDRRFFQRRKKVVAVFFDLRQSLEGGSTFEAAAEWCTGENVQHAQELP